MVPADSLVETAPFVVGRCDRVRSFPGQAVVIRNVCIATLRIGASVSRHHYPFAVAYENRRLYHYRRQIRHFRYRPVAVDSSFRADAIDARLTHVGQADIFAAHRAAAVAVRHIAAIFDRAPGQSAVGARQIDRAGDSLFAIVIMAYLAVLEHRKSYVGIRWRSGHLYGRPHRVKRGGNMFRRCGPGEKAWQKRK